MNMGRFLREVILAALKSVGVSCALLSEFVVCDYKGRLENSTCLFRFQLDQANILHFSSSSEEFWMRLSESSIETPMAGLEPLLPLCH